jgi:hypothetical protein
MRELLEDGGFEVDGMYGVFHGPRLTEMDARHGGSIIEAQIARAVADAPWPADLLADVAAVRCEDFEIVRERSDQGTGSEADRRDIDDSLDLLAIAVRP